MLINQSSTNYITIRASKLLSVSLCHSVGMRKRNDEKAVEVTSICAILEALMNVITEIFVKRTGIMNGCTVRERS